MWIKTHRYLVCMKDKLTHYDDTQKRAHGSQIVRAKKKTSSWATVGPTNDKHEAPTNGLKYVIKGSTFVLMHRSTNFECVTWRMWRLRSLQVWHLSKGHCHKKHSKSLRNVSNYQSQDDIKGTQTSMTLRKLSQRLICLAYVTRLIRGLWL